MLFFIFVLPVHVSIIVIVTLIGFPFRKRKTDPVYAYDDYRYEKRLKFINCKCNNNI